jgi:hypothetical protein
MCLWTIVDYKSKSSYVAHTDVLLPDKLNTFFARFEDCGLSFSMADVSKTFKH